VFLNKLIRERCPGVRVFTTEPSVAFTHPSTSYQMRGVVVGSTYPIHSGPAFWTTPRPQKPDQDATYSYGEDNSRLFRPRVLPFPTQGSQGYSNPSLSPFRPAPPI